MIWIIGKNGMLGSELCRQLEETGFEWRGTDREADVRSKETVRRHAAEMAPAWIVNCAAYTLVDRAEDEIEEAYSLNAKGAGIVAEIANEVEATLVHISTDYVFDGSSRLPYKEDFGTAPLNVYGASKAKGEQLVAAACSRAFILRTAWLYGRSGKNFVNTMLAQMAERESVKVVVDQIGSPTYVVDLAHAILSMIAKKRDGYGIYNYTNDGEASWFDLAVAIRQAASELGAPVGGCEIVPIPSEQYLTKAKRPKFSVLSKEKARKILELEIPQWRESLRAYLRLRAMSGWTH